MSGFIDKVLMPPLDDEPEIEDMSGEVEVEIEVDPDEAIEEIISGVDEAMKAALPHDANLVAAMDEEELPKLALRVIELYDADLRSRMDWEDDYRDNLRLLGLKVEKRTIPWENACGVMHPMIAEALIRFQATTIMEMFPVSGPFRAKVQGRSDEKLTDAADRLQREFNWIATKEMPEYRTEVEQGLWRMGLSGVGFRKVWKDPIKQRPVAETIPAEDIVVPFVASHIYSTPRISHVIRKDKIETDKMVASGWWADADLPEPEPIVTETEDKEGEQVGVTYTHETDGRYEFIEMQVDWNLPGFERDDDLPVPYVITVEKQNLKVVAIRRNWRESDPTCTRLHHINAMIYIPGWGFYGIGLLTLMAGLATGSTSLLRQLVDAGTLANLAAGFKGQGLRMKGDSSPLRPGEFREVELFSGKLSENIMPMKFPEPSGTLLTLMGSMVDAGKRLGMVAELPTKTGEMPVGTIVAMIEHETRPHSAVQARIYAAFSEELDMIRLVVTTSGRQYKAPGNEGFDMQEDLKLPILLLPVSDPNASTSAVRILQAQAAVEASAKNPTMYDQPYVHRAMLKAMGVGDVDLMVPDKNQTLPADPISENMALLNGKPVKAGIDQDHRSHMKAHMALTEDPRMAMIIGQSPQAQVIAGAIASHLAEHAGYMHRDEVLAKMGFSVPLGPLPPELESRIAPLVAEAAKKAAEEGKAKAAQQKNEQAAQDPMIKLEMMDYELKKDKNEKDFKIDLETLKLKAKEIGAKIADQAEKAKQTREEAGIKILADATRSTGY